MGSCVTTVIVLTACAPDSSVDADEGAADADSAVPSSDDSASGDSNATGGPASDEDSGTGTDADDATGEGSTGAPDDCSPTDGELVAFPGAVGYGARTVGGRGGRAIAVTTLEDSGPGSLREALSASGPRTIQFEVAGVIALQDELTIADPFVTLAGQTAPGGGVVIKGNTLKIQTHEVVIRHMRLRPGDELTSTPDDTDALTLNGNNDAIYNVIVDHTDMIWGPDMGGAALLGDVTNVTFQSSIIGHGLYLSQHAEGTDANGGHAYGFNVTPMTAGAMWAKNLTLYRNLLTTGSKRMPAIKSAECADVVNNIVYNWGDQSAGGNPRSQNIVGNWYRPGPGTETFSLFKPHTIQDDPTTYPDAVYLADNVADGFDGTLEGPDEVYADTVRCGELSVLADPAGVAYDTVIEDAGATLPNRDDISASILAEVVAGTGGYYNGVGNPAPNPSWPPPADGNPPTDADRDGMPDDWETSQFGDTSRGSAMDSSSDLDGDGFTDLEEYLNGTDPNTPGC
jgi:pectate lyase